MSTVWPVWRRFPPDVLSVCPVCGGGGGGLLPLFFDHVDGSVDGSVVRRPSVNVISNVISIIA